MTRHQGKVRGYLRQLTRNPAVADDLAQETFIRAWDKLASFSGKGSFLSWLLAIAHKQFLQSLRKNKRDQRLLSEIEHDPAGDAAAPLSGSASEELADLPTLLGALSEPGRTTLVLAYGYGLSHAEIGEATGMAVGTVKSHIHRGKAKIRERFALERTGHE